MLPSTPLDLQCHVVSIPTGYAATGTFHLSIPLDTNLNRHITPQTIESACEASQAVSYRKAADDRGL